MTAFPPGFFDRADESPDTEFYAFDRLVTHIDEGATAAVTELYRELGLAGDVLDLCSSWVSHFDPAPEHLVAMGMNVNELDANPAVSEYLVQDLNVEPRLPFGDESFDAVTCCVSIDYLTRPVEVFAEVGRVWRERSGEMAQNVAIGLFPAMVVDASVIARTDAYLADTPEVPSALARLLLEGRDGIARCLRARARDAAAG